MSSQQLPGYLTQEVQRRQFGFQGTDGGDDLTRTPDKNPQSGFTTQGVEAMATLKAAFAGCIFSSSCSPQPTTLGTVEQ